MYNPKVLFSLVLFLAIAASSIGQKPINRTADFRAIYGITSSTGYNFKIVDGEISADSIIAVHRTFNTKGFRTETAIYKEGKLTTKYQYEYLSDTLLDERRTYEHSDTGMTLLHITKYEYDKKLRLKKVFDSYTSTKYKGKLKTKYNKEGLLSKMSLKFNGKKVREEKNKYDKYDNLIEKISYVPYNEKFVYSYNKNQLTHKHKVFENGDKKLIQYYEQGNDRMITRHILNNAQSVLSINGKIKLWHTDVLTTERIYEEDLQLHQETEFLNGELYGFRKYHFNQQNLSH